MGSIVVPSPPCGTAACAQLLRELAAAAESRDVIGMAKGLLIARGSSGPDHAFGVLRRASQRENVKLQVIAQRLVAAASTDRVERRTTMA
jgi:AmiR/NasT family two-component response regulator